MVCTPRQIPLKVSIHIRLWEFPALTKNYTKDAKQHTKTHMSSAMTSATFTFHNDLLRDAIDQSKRTICEWLWTVEDYGNTPVGRYRSHTGIAIRDASIKQYNSTNTPARNYINIRIELIQFYATNDRVYKVPTRSLSAWPLTWWRHIPLGTLLRNARARFGPPMSVMFFSRPRSEGWPRHGRTFSIYLCPLTF